MIRRIGGKPIPKGYVLGTYHTKSEAERQKNMRDGNIRIKKSKVGHTLYRYD